VQAVVSKTTRRVEDEAMQGIVNEETERRLVVAYINPLNPELNPICYLLALLGAHHFLPLAG